MTAAAVVQSRLGVPVVPMSWVTVAQAEVDTTVEGGGVEALVVFTGSTSPGSQIEVRAVSELEESVPSIVTKDVAVIELPRVTLPAGVSTVKLEARTVGGTGALKIVDTAILIGEFNDPTEALYLEAQADVIVDEFADLIFTTPSHNGTIQLRQWVDGAWVDRTANQSPASTSATGLWSWIVTRTGEVGFVDEFNVTVTPAAIPATVLAGGAAARTVAPGTIVPLTALATGAADLAWVWQRLVAADWVEVESGTGNTATIAAGPVTETTSYRCVFSSALAADSVQTAPTIITVTDARLDGAAVTDIERD